MGIFDAFNKRLTPPKDSYLIKVFCENCEEFDVVTIKRGTVVDEYLKEFVCQNCGCKKVRKSASQSNYY